MGCEIAQRPPRCASNTKTSEWERAGYKKGGGHPLATSCVRAFQRSWIPRRTGGNPPRRSGPACWSQQNHLPTRQEFSPSVLTRCQNRAMMQMLTRRQNEIFHIPAGGGSGPPACERSIPMSNRILWPISPPAAPPPGLPAPSPRPWGRPV